MTEYMKTVFRTASVDGTAKDRVFVFEGTVEQTAQLDPFTLILSSPTDEKGNAGSFMSFTPGTFTDLKAELLSDDLSLLEVELDAAKGDRYGS